jgi:subtilase family serine protease
MQHMQLLLLLPMEKEEELNKLLHQIQDPNSPDYHKWLTPEQFGREFSLASGDVRVIIGWLRSKGFSINLVRPRTIDFSRTAGQVRDAFGTEIHYLDVRGVRHIANMRDPQIPTALEPAVASIVSLNDFKPHPMNGVH